MKAADSKKRAAAKRATLAKVVDKNKKIKVRVSHAANRLALVNRALKQGHKALIPLETMNEAIVQNEDVENQVTQAADDLALVNTELAKEVAEREDVEAKLANTKTRLTKVRSDLSQSQAREEESRKLALQDALTKLPNRVIFEQVLDQALNQAKRQRWGLAVLFIDLDDFKHFNDHYGHDMGDKILLMVADRLQACVRTGDTVSRWGGDEFVCLLLEVKQKADVTHVAEKMVQCIAEDWEVDGTVHSIKASIGIALYPTDGKTVETLLKNADQAMYHVKRSKK